MSKPLVGVSGFDAAASSHYEGANLARGGAAFTVLAAMTMRTVPEAAAVTLAGAGGGVTDGWRLLRGINAGATTANFAWNIGYSGGQQSNSQTFNIADIIGRTMLFGVTVNATAAIYYTNGGQIGADTGVGAVTAAASALCLGGSLTGLGVVGMPDDLHGMLYTPSVLTPLEMGNIFRQLVQTRSLQQAVAAAGVTPELLYDVATLAVSPSLTPPTSWASIGSTVTPVTWVGASTANLLTFDVNSEAQFSNGAP